MATKRPHDGDGAASSDAPRQASSKRARKGAGAGAKPRQHQNAFIDSTFGQKYFFTGQGTKTSVPKDEELDFEDDSEAMAYLNSVRHQANGIPHLLVAPKVKMGPELPEDFAAAVGAADEGEYEYADDDDYDYDYDYDEYYKEEGWYEDGAYTAAPDVPPADNIAEIEPRQVLAEAYYSGILDRFHALRAVLHRKPPAALVAALPKTHGTFVGSFGPRSSTFVIWNKRLFDSDPLPVQLAAMDKDGALRVLRVLMGGKFLRMGHDLRERTSRWLWGLLARLPEPGEMQHTDIAWIRDLGRRAVLMTRSLAEMAALREELANAGGDLGAHDAVDESDTDSNCLVEMDVDNSDEVLIHGDKVCEEGARDSSGQDARGAAAALENSTEPGADAAGAMEHADDGSVAENPDTVGTAEVDAVATAQDSDAIDVAKGGDAVGAAEEGDSMEISEDEGEVSSPEPEPQETLEAAKARLLARLTSTAATDPAAEPEYVKEPEIANPPTTDCCGSDADADADADNVAAEEREKHARANMRHTLNMILTVAGEVYGQRDLLEFRDPFPGL